MGKEDIPTNAMPVDSQMSAIFTLPVSANPQTIPLNPPIQTYFCYLTRSIL